MMNHTKKLLIRRNLLLIFLSIISCLATPGCGSGSSQKSSTYDAGRANRDQQAAELWYEMEMEKLQLQSDINRMSNEAFGSPSID
ncbi:hypothetical protein [Gimesia maris]|uniref:Secreted protein n=1 Tax=Gimesia maris TaxID=122 RepID=A0ABX5YR95_9PLAN|nr:hypothetical protein [Gimesia maris]EDL59203.1 hypothetical protein PM8797T_23189 [Gimesia maris DSM 8797]QEG18254.1 hypothetical protein GmarT_41400 [Gimesia maris]QGQ28752.1 hypothetical protein F1729_08915 [Gimesia maris]